MKRDIDLCRKILLRLENAPSESELKKRFEATESLEIEEGKIPSNRHFYETMGVFLSYLRDSIYYEGYSREQVSYHVMLLAESGLIKANDYSQTELIKSWFPIRL